MSLESLLMGEYETWTDDALQEHSDWLYEEYLNGEDYLDDLHRIAEILNRASEQDLINERFSREIQAGDRA